MGLNQTLFFVKISLQIPLLTVSILCMTFTHPVHALSLKSLLPLHPLLIGPLGNSLKTPEFPHLWLCFLSLPEQGSSVRCLGIQLRALQPQSTQQLRRCPFGTWKTVTMAQSKESKFFLSGSVSPSRSEANLQPKRCIPRMLQGREGRGSTRGAGDQPEPNGLLLSPGKGSALFKQTNNSLTGNHPGWLIQISWELGSDLSESFSQNLLAFSAALFLSQNTVFQHFLNKTF